MTGLQDIENFRRLSPRVLSSGQPRPEQFPAIAAAGVRDVINLALPSASNAVADEAQRWAGLGLRYHPIPVVWERPTARDLRQFFERMDQLLADGEAPVYVHCARNLRASAFLFLYRVLTLGDARGPAEAAMLDVWQPNAIWQAFIDEALSGTLS